MIRHAVWLYFRFGLSFRDVEELMVQRGIDLSYTTILCWTVKSGPLIASRLSQKASQRTDGAVSLTLKVLHFEGCKPLVEKAFYETAIV